MYVKFAGVSLSDFFHVKAVNTTVLPNRENYSIKIPSRTGEIYNGFRYGTREITISFLVRPEDPYDYSQYVTDITNALDVKSPSRLYIGDETRYYYAVPDGDIEINEIGLGVGEGEVNFICYDPVLYSDLNKIYSGTNKVYATNGGSTDTYPLIRANFSQESHFVQITNSVNGKAILVGEWPIVGQSSQNLAGEKLSDNCQTTTNWYSAGNVVDSGRLVEGGITINSGGYGIKANNFGTTTDQSWHGPAVRRNINTNIQDFEVVATFEHDSKGKNASDIVNTPPSTPDNGIDYRTTANLNIREGRGTNFRILTTMPKGTTVKVTDINQGWGKVTYGNHTGYSFMQYLSLNSPTNSTHKVSTSGKGLNLRTGRGTKYKILLSIPNGTNLSISDISGGWGKTSYKGKTGYVSMQYVSAVKSAKTLSKNTRNVDDTADDRLGIIELYGFDNNGQKLFKMSLNDTNEWYEYTWPEVQIGNNVVLQESANAPAPRTKVEKDDKGEDVTVNDLSGKFGKWNEFYGNIRVRRETVGNKQQWYCEVNKIKDDKVVESIKTSTLVSDSYPKGSLNHLVLYVGAYKDKKQVEMTLTNVTVNQLNTVPPKVNQKIFKNGDELEIDCSSNMVYLNKEPYMQHVDIGSQFFELTPGTSDIRVHSDDTGIFSTVTVTERWL